LHEYQEKSMELWITDKNRLGQPRGMVHEYAFELAMDGSFTLQLWGIWGKPPGEVAVALNDQPLSQGVPAQEDQRHWRLGTLTLPRGRHKLTVTATEPFLGALLSDDPEIVASGKAILLWDNRQVEGLFERRIRRNTDAERKLLVRHGFLFEREFDAEKCNVPSGVPLGGIGAGKVELTAKGLFTAATTNNNQDCPIYRLPGSYFAIQAEAAGGQERVTRLLQTQSVDQFFRPVQAIEASLKFPEAQLAYRDPFLPVDVELHAFSPHVPHDVENSSLPCALFRFTLRNPSGQTQTIRLLYSWENIVNVGGSMTRSNQNPDELLPLVHHTWNHSFPWSCRKANFQEPAAGEGDGLQLAARDDQHNPSSFGRHMIWTPSGASTVLDRDIEADELAFVKWFEAGALGGFTPAGRGVFRAGALIVQKTLAPGAADTVDFVLAWHMPRQIDARGNDIGVQYGRRFADVSAVVRHAWSNRPTLLEQSQWVRKALEDSSLPAWLVTKLLNERFVVNTNTTFDSLGRFSVNEAPTGMCNCLGTLDQRTCSGGYWTLFYPSLDAVELEMFTRCQGQNGAPAHDLGNGHFNLTPRGFPWPDLAAAYVIQVHRHFLRTGDRGFLARHWPFVKSAVEWAISLDETGDAIPTLKPGRGTTYDNQQWDGISAFIATLHEAGLALGADLAARAGDRAIAARWSQLASQAARSRQKHLWVESGGYLRNAFDPATGKADEGVFLAALAGDWAILAGGLDVHLDRAILGRAMESIFKKCLLGRGMTDQGGKNNTQSAFMQYPMAYFAGAALLLGRDDLAWNFALFQDQAITCPPSTHFNQTLTYNPDGTPYGLPYYMTAPASWLFMDAVAGNVPDLDHHRLTLGTSWLLGDSPRKTPVFLTSGWFSVESRCDAPGVTLTLTPIRSFAPFNVQTLALRLGEKCKASTALVNGRPVTAKSAAGTLELPVNFDPGRDALTVKIMA
jgi:uncharacterized protein (DUF608 family)